MSTVCNVPFQNLENIKRPLNLNEEIAAMAKSDTTCITNISTEGTRIKDEERQNHAIIKSNTSESKSKRKKSRSQLVQEIRISVSFFFYS